MENTQISTPIPSRAPGEAPVPEVTCSIRLSEKDEAQILSSAEKPPAPNEAAVQAARRFLQNHG